MSLRPSRLTILAIALTASSGLAQTPAKAPTPASGAPPVIQSIKPPGGPRGGTLTLTVAGQGLGKCDSAVFSGTGLELIEIKAKDDNSLTLTVKVDPDTDLGFQDVRVVSPDGISNLRTIRIDSLNQVEEIEPNDEPGKGQIFDLPLAITGVLIARDVDHFRLKCLKGQRLAIEVEAQRLGTAISPVVSILAENGASLIQARESRGTDRDCRLSFLVPADGIYVIQVRDNIYAGGDAATYRLRVETLPFATAIFPLGGKAGQPLVISASGGNLEGVRTKTILLPNELGKLIEVGAFDGPGGPILVPGKVLVGDSEEILETDQRPTLLPLTATANGRIAHPGEVDRYAVPVKTGDAIRLKIRAADLGSWLDSVIAVVDAKGTILAENDEPTTNGGNRGNGTFFGLNTDSPDSVLDYTAKEDGTLLVEVTDRYGDGGPEFGYRLSALAAKPDFELNLLIGAAVAGTNQARPVQGLGAFGVYNLRQGMSIPINFLITTQGTPGNIKVEIEGLPPGVTAAPVEIKLEGKGSAFPLTKVVGTTVDKASQSFGGAIVLKVDADAQPGLLSEFRVIATAIKQEVPLRKVGAATIVLNAQAGAPGTRTPSRSFSSFPIKLAGKTPLNLVGPLVPFHITSVVIPSVLLPGGTVNLGLEFSHKLDPTTYLALTASVAGQGLTATIEETPASTSPAETPRQYQVQIKAAMGVEPGVRDVKVTCRVGGYAPETKVVSIIIRPMFVMRSPSEGLTIAPGEKLRVPVLIDRAAGFDAMVELRIFAMPAGLQLAQKRDIAVGTSHGWVDLTLDSNAKSVARVDILQVGAVAQGSGGELSTKLAIPVKIKAASSDK